MTSNVTCDVDSLEFNFGSVQSIHTDVEFNFDGFQSPTISIYHTLRACRSFYYTNVNFEDLEILNFRIVESQNSSMLFNFLHLLFPPFLSSFVIFSIISYVKCSRNWMELNGITQLLWKTCISDINLSLEKKLIEI